MIEQLQMPWWMGLLSGAFGIGLGLVGALPWRSAAEAAKTERDALKETNERLRAERLELEKENAVLKAKTDLNGLRGEVMLRLKEITEEFKSHSDQDNSIAQQQTAALEAVKVTLGVIQEQMKK